MNEQTPGESTGQALSLNKTFATALRSELVARASRQTSVRRRGILLGAGIGAVIALAGGAAAVATGVVVLGGGTEVTQLGDVRAGSFKGTDGLDLGMPPEGTTGVSISFTCLSPGVFTFDDGAGTSCSSPGDGSPTTYVLDVDSLEGTRVTISTSPEAQWSLTASYVSERITEWNVNENGQTYGVENEFGSPDLVAAVATNGRLGYVTRIDLDEATGTTASRGFKSPEDALAWQEERRGKVFEIPVYEPDGVTQIGTFRVG